MGNALWRLCCCCDDVYGGGNGDDQYAYYYPAPAPPAAGASSSSRPQYYGAAAATVSSPNPTSSLLLPQQQAPPLVPHGAVASSTCTGLLRPQSQPAPAAAPESIRRKQHPPLPHGVAVASSANISNGMILWPKKQQPAPPQPPLVSHGVAAASSARSSLLQFEHDLLSFVLTEMVPEGLGEHVTSSKKEQAKWYRNISEAYVKTEPPPRTSAEAAILIATSLSRIQEANLEGILAFYGFAIPTPPIVTKEHPSSSLPDGVQFMLNTLPVDAKGIGDGDGFTAYVDTADPMESSNVPLEVHKAVIAMAQSRKDRNNQKKNVLQNRLDKAGYRIMNTSENEILAKQYRIRLRGIDAPEMGMQYGKESQNALVKLIAGKSVMVYVYGQDQYNRYVGDIYCDGVFIQEQILKEGHAWHYKIYDKRPEFAKWEKKARHARQGLWAYDNPEKPWDWKRSRHDKTSGKPEKPWEWRRKTHNASHENTAIQWEKKARHARQGLWAYDNPEKPWDWKRSRHEKTSDKPEKPWEWRRKTHNASQEHRNSGVLIDLNPRWRGLE